MALALGTTEVNAQSIQDLNFNSLKAKTFEVSFNVIPFAEQKEPQPEPIQPAPTKKPKPKIIKYTIRPGDNLFKIAKRFGTSWQRLFYKNKHIKNPHRIWPGQTIVIPPRGQKLKPRSSPTVSVRPPAAAKASPAPYSGPVGGNTYTYGYCTWYVKNRRPDLPSGLGDAISWFSRATALGLAVGYQPRAGAVGTQGNHVVYVEHVNSDGTVLVSEMNWVGWNITSSRTAPASDFAYIY